MVGIQQSANWRNYGITIFYILSQFLDDWINLFIGSKMFSNLMKRRGIDHAMRELLSPKFDKAVVKEAFIFTGKQWLGGQVKGLIGYFINLYVIMITPQMASWSGLLLIPNFLGHLVSMVNLTSGSVPAISESYNNGKKELAQYFIHDMFKYYVFITMWMAVPLMVMTPHILETVMGLEIVKGLENYQAGLIMIPWLCSILELIG
jgi:O-antigen/teichoic acid export membrane protein